MNKGKEEIDKQYKSLISKLTIAKNEIGGFISPETKFKQIQDSFKEQLDNMICATEIKLNEVQANIIWDRLVIAFFGETNAGKSTIIETFRILYGDGGKGNDGQIVGDGQSDFTKVYEKYDLNINGHPITLIDVPGIEGREEDYKNEIKDALLKAHCVFYIQGHNKEPDTKTAMKIKQYLNEWVKVYSIYNSRGGAENYDEEEEREMLYTEKVNTQTTLNTHSFEKILGSCYQGNITIQALIAMCAYAQFAPKRTDLVKQQQLLLSYFGSAQNAYNFSHFKDIVALVDTLSMNYHDNIRDAINQKFKACVNEIISNLRLSYKENQELIDLFSKQLSQFRLGVQTEVTKFSNSTNQSIFYLIDSEFNTTYDKLCKAIDNEVGKSELRRLAQELGENLSMNLSNALPSLVDKKLKDLSDRIVKIKKDLNKCLTINLNSHISQSNTQLDIKSNQIIKELDFKLSDFSVLLCANNVKDPTTKIIILILGMIKYYFFDKSEKKAKAKAAVQEELDSVKDKVKSDTTNALHQIYSKIDKDKRTLLSEIKNDISSLKDIKDELENLYDKLQNIN